MQTVRRQQGCHELGIIPRFDDKVCRSFLHGSHRQINVRVSREQDHGDFRGIPLDSRQPVKSLVPGIDSRREIHI